MGTLALPNGLWSSRGQTSLRTKWVPLPRKSPFITVKLFILTILNFNHCRVIETVSPFSIKGMYPIMWKVLHTEVAIVLLCPFHKHALAFYTRTHMKENVRWMDALRSRHQELLSRVVCCEALFNLSIWGIFTICCCISISQWGSEISSNF